MCKESSYLNFRSKLAFYFTGLLCLTACGLNGINTGGSSVSPNDPRPSGVPLFQGNLFPQNGQTASGTVLVFFSGMSAYIVRLEGISVTVANGLQVVVYAGGSVVSTQALRASTGSQNYNVTANSGVTFNNVYIYSTPNNLNYAVASLTANTTTTTNTGTNSSSNSSDQVPSLSFMDTELTRPGALGERHFVLVFDEFLEVPHIRN